MNELHWIEPFTRVEGYYTANQHKTIALWPMEILAVARASLCDLKQQPEISQKDLSYLMDLRHNRWENFSRSWRKTDILRAHHRKLIAGL
jgi:hypothetical protein